MAEPEYAEEYSSSERWRLLALLFCAGLALVLVSELCLFPWIKSFASTAHCRWARHGYVSA
ncbi:MAG: hypothetical protein WC809_20035 [Sinimarinibacterium sp.]|jgi:hypothetical protein